MLQATPLVAGIAALLFETKGKSAAVGLSARTLFQTTAKPVKSSHDEGALFDTVTRQGAGVVNAYDALKTTTIVSPGQILLNDTEHIQKTFVCALIGCLR